MIAADRAALPAFLAGAGEMGPRIHGFDWSATPLGPLDSWPSALKTAVSLILGSPQPMWIGWGPQMILLYNGACLPLLGAGKHPRALGLPASEAWPELWERRGSPLDRVWQGEAASVDGLRLFIDRAEWVEETFYSFAHSPIRDDSGRVCGVFCSCHEVTGRFVNARRLATLSGLVTNALAGETVADACAAAAGVLGKNPDDLPFALLYLADAEGRQASLEQAVGAFAPGFQSPPVIDLRAGTQTPWPVGEVYRSGDRRIVPAGPFAGLPPGPAAHAVRHAVVLPLISSGRQLPVGVLVAGVNPCRPLDEGYLTFFDLIAAQLAAAILYDGLRHSRERLRTIVETTPECVKVVAADGTLVEMNPAGLAMIGADSSEDALGKSVYELIAPESRDAFREFHERICRGEKGSLEFEIIGLKGHRRRMETHAVPMRNPDGTLAQLAITRDITERQRRERAALLLSSIVDSSDDAIISKDLNGIITSWNKSAQRVFGYTAEETVGRSITILIPPERLDEEPQILARLRRGERVDHFETVRRHKDGTLLDISLTISPVRDAQGKIIGASKIARNITDRKRAERAIEALNAQLSADLSAMTRMQRLSARLVQASDFTVLLGEILDAAIEITGAAGGNIQLLQDGALKVIAECGLESGALESLQRAARTLFPPRERVIVEDLSAHPLFAGTPAAQALLASERRALQSTPLVSRTGEVLGVFSTLYRVAGAPNERELRLLDILARLAADWIERQRAEHALLESEAKFRQLADSMPQMVWTARPDGSLDYYNERWYEFTGASRGGFSENSWKPFLHPDDAGAAAGAWLESVASGQPYRVECRLWDRRERRWRWFMARALPARDSAGKIVKWFGTTTDIDEQKRVEAELRSANQDLEQFAYSASHDLQEPLRSIKIYGELLASRYAARLDGQALEFLGFLRAGASRMEALVRDLLAYTQITQLEAPDQPADAGEVLAGAISSLNGAIVSSGARVTSDPLPPARVHATHLAQLFQNLVGNAIKYRHPERPPVVHVSGRQENGHSVFSVRDNGIGIPPEYKEHIFGLFKRLHTGDEYSGTGIGLAICQRIVERYRGRIWVESEPGRGSTFLFSVPV